MEIITFESKAYKELDNKITAIANFIFNQLDESRTNEDEIWVDSYEVCTFLQISDRTLQRLRANGNPLPEHKFVIQITTPKQTKSCRDVPLSEQVSEALLMWKAKQTADKKQ